VVKSAKTYTIKELKKRKIGRAECGIVEEKEERRKGGKMKSRN
jgi:hypothetical protein